MRCNPLARPWFEAGGCWDNQFPYSFRWEVVLLSYGMIRHHTDFSLVQPGPGRGFTFSLAGGGLLLVSRASGGKTTVTFLKVVYEGYWICGGKGGGHVLDREITSAFLKTEKSFVEAKF